MSQIDGMDDVFLQHLRVFARNKPRLSGDLGGLECPAAKFRFSGA
jgi:hypothetical protein